MKSGHCDHCGSPDRFKRCRYAWWLPNAADWKRSGADPPCVLDSFDESMARVDRGFHRRLIVILAVIALAVAFGWRFS